MVKNCGDSVHLQIAERNILQEMIKILNKRLLETMVKNCGDSVHLQIAERNILQEMIKIVKKRGTKAIYGGENSLGSESSILDC
ncbi:TOM1-like protein 7 [Cornus florida]|uniref:TOM1-like protein 7 n=1 Tax=Cornus florida TaxID=4283 RepID=UPI00289DBDE4|nr:TOM1-like protein 7 [Cornus florida]XP_059653355.1 TOM1-like protein 7 [Cornus florida]